MALFSTLPPSPLSSSLDSSRIPSLLFPLWGPGLVDPIDAYLKWPGEREKDPAARLCSCRGEGRGWAVCVLKQGLQIMTCRGLGDL